MDQTDQVIHINQILTAFIKKEALIILKTQFNQIIHIGLTKGAQIMDQIQIHTIIYITIPMEELLQITFFQIIPILIKIIEIKVFP